MRINKYLVLLDLILFLSVAGTLSERTHHRLVNSLVLKLTVLLHVVSILKNFNICLTLYKGLD
jgi:hypothetical protein